MFGISLRSYSRDELSSFSTDESEFIGFVLMNYDGGALLLPRNVKLLEWLRVGEIGDRDS